MKFWPNWNTLATRTLLGHHQSMLYKWVRTVLLQKICQGWEGCENQHGWGGASKRLNPRCGWGRYPVSGCSWGVDDCGVTGTGSKVHSWRSSKSKGSCGRKRAPQIHDGAFPAAQFTPMPKTVRTVWCSYWQICGRREVGQAAHCGYLEMDSSLGTTVAGLQSDPRKHCRLPIGQDGEVETMVLKILTLS